MSRIIVPQRRLILPTRVGLAGRYTLAVRRPDRIDRYAFHNLITNSGLDSVGLSTAVTPPNDTAANCAWCAVGTGNTTPAETDTELTAFLAGVQGAFSNATSGTGYRGALYTYAFAQGAVVGNIAEVGTGMANSGGTGFNPMFSHALILDSNKNPTTIPCTAFDQLTVTYEVDVYWPTTDTTVNITDSNTGQVYAVTCRTAETTLDYWWGSQGPNVYAGSSNAFTAIMAYTGALGPITGDPADQIGNQFYYTRGSYVSGSYERIDTFKQDINDWNGSLTAFVWTCALGTFQFGFSPAVPKTNTQTLTLDRSISWSRH